MSKILSLLVALFLPTVVFAADVVSFIGDITDIFNRLIPILLGLMIAVFFWGVIKFITHADDEKAVAEGKGVMIWGVVGIGVVSILWGIVGYIQATLGLNTATTVGSGPQILTNIP